MYPEIVDVAPIIRRSIEINRARPAGGRTVGEVAETLWAVADPIRLEQVLNNLLINAMQYAPQGPIVVRGRTAGGIVTIEVVDTGPGIPLNEQPRVWERFYRGTNVAGLNIVPGTGLGLAIVKSLVEAQGGRVGLVSVPNRGSCFQVCLQAAALPAGDERGESVVAGWSAV